MVSTINTAQKSSVYYDIWKYTSSLYFTIATSIYILFMYLVINNYLLDHQLDFLKLKISTIGKYNFILNMAIFFFIPIMSINYLLIFKGNKYKYLIKEYKESYNKKLFVWYFMIALVFMCGSLFLKK